MAELRLSIRGSDLQTALGRFFGEVSCEKYCEMGGGFGDISEEESEFYSKFNQGFSAQTDTVGEFIKALKNVVRTSYFRIIYWAILNSPTVSQTHEKYQ